MSVNIYCRLLRLDVSTHVFKLAYAMIKNRNKVNECQLFSIVDFRNLYEYSCFQN